ncbi:MFS transporter [Gordonia spumicola]|uniref:MFS transporter n=1 Tax=Gordonia spumicola TaxID=589161 RepID=A0A7I9V7B2_9ACTN|nr:MFS transporter [Gordonia spumicola]GEE01275.1 MFS transporter [Gordonia spumicola]
MTTTTVPQESIATRWSAIAVMMATSFVLVTAEFLPPSLLPAMASSLGVSEGNAGQTVTATAFVGFLTAPTIGVLLPRLDRRLLLVGLTVLAAGSNLLVAVSGNIWLLLAARLLLGASIGGFWAMSIAVASRLARPEHLGRAMMIVNTGTTVATVAGVPLGAYLGSVFDWRVVFAGAAVLSVAVSVALWRVLPFVAPAGGERLGALTGTVRVPGIARGLTGHVLTVFGHFVAFTYIRVALERDPDLNAATIAAILVVFGVGGVVGNFVVGLVVDKHLDAARYLVPALIAASVAAVAAAPNALPVVVIAVATWGFAFGSWLMVVSTWIGRVAPDRIEAGGGLLVAGFQIAITLGASIGGAIADSVGITIALWIAVAAAVVGGALFGSARGPVSRPSSAASEPEAVLCAAGTHG